MVCKRETATLALPDALVYRFCPCFGMMPPQAVSGRRQGWRWPAAWAAGAETGRCTGSSPRL